VLSSTSTKLLRGSTQVLSNASAELQRFELRILFSTGRNRKLQQWL